MMEFLEFYLSSFWRWAGITIGAYVIFAGTAITLSAFASIFRRKG